MEKLVMEIEHDQFFMREFAKIGSAATAQGVRDNVAKNKKLELSNDFYRTYTDPLISVVIENFTECFFLLSLDC